MNSFTKVQSWKVEYLSGEKGNRPVGHKLVNAINVSGALIGAIKIIPGDALIFSIAVETEERGYNYDSQSEAFI